MKIIRCLAQGLVAALMAGPASAVLVSEESLVFDTETRLQWLRLDNEVLLNKTWEQAATAVPGFRLATAGEVTTFFSHAGIEDRFGRGENPAVISLLHMWGIVFKTPWYDDSRFWLADEGFPGTHAIGALTQVYELEPGNGAAWLALPWDRWGQEADPFVSAALVREIPEPSTQVLLLVGMAILWRVGVVGPTASRGTVTCSWRADASAKA